MSSSGLAVVWRFVLWSRNKYSVIGLVWGSLELGIILVGSVFGYLLGHVDRRPGPSGIIASPIDELLVFLIFIISLLSGYALRDPEKSIKALLISQFTTFFAILSLLYLSPSIFPSVYSSVYAAGFTILSFILGMFGCLVGSFSGEFLSRSRRTHRISLNNYRLALIAILLLVLALGSIALVESLVNSLNRQNASLASDNGNLRDTIKSIYGYSNLTYSTVVTPPVTRSWQRGVANITLYPSPGFNYGYGIPYPGYLAVSWNSTSSLTFNFLVYDVFVRTPGTTSGTYNIPVLKTASNFADSGWFHNEMCSPSGCPSGNVTYSTVYWF